MTAIRRRDDPERRPGDGWLYVEHHGRRWSHLSVDWPSGKALTDPDFLDLAKAVSDRAVQRCLTHGHPGPIHHGVGVGYWVTMTLRKDELSVVNAWVGLGVGDTLPAQSYLAGIRRIDLDQWANADVSAGFLVAQGMCHPSCLLAVGAEQDECGCRCHGAWHGTLVETYVVRNRLKRADAV